MREVRGNTAHKEIDTMSTIQDFDRLCERIEYADRAAQQSTGGENETGWIKRQSICLSSWNWLELMCLSATLWDGGETRST